MTEIFVEGRFITVKQVIIIDSETTGLDAKHDEILQLTILSNNGDVLFNEYIRPLNHTEWPEAEKIHHISYDMVKDSAPLSYHQKTIQQLIDSADTIVGYNHSFDMAFLENAGIKSDAKKNYDLMLEFSQLKGDWDSKHNHYKWYTLKECADYFGYDWGTNSSHNSLSDCKAVLYCYNKMLAGETGEGGRKNKNQHPSVFRGSSLTTKIHFRKKILVLPVVVLLIIGGFLVIPRSSQAPKRKRTTITTSTLQKVLNISDFSTLEFRYGSVVQSQDDKGKAKYYVTYNGTVKIGIDFAEIAKNITIDPSAKTVTVKIPEPKVLSTNVNVDTLDYIFMKDKYNKTGLTDEALKLCKQDLKNELDNTPEVFHIARENAETAVKQLLDPWLKNVDPEYTIIIK